MDRPKPKHMALRNGGSKCSWFRGTGESLVQSFVPRPRLGNTYYTRLEQYDGGTTAFPHDARGHRVGKNATSRRDLSHTQEAAGKSAARRPGEPEWRWPDDEGCHHLRGRLSRIPRLPEVTRLTTARISQERTTSIARQTEPSAEQPASVSRIVCMYVHGARSAALHVSLTPDSLRWNECVRPLPTNCLQTEYVGCKPP
ncbi:hypothetical protein BT67DRAFT_70363 [Trichocladium antarcticum]|uniref:Uncharacterized protein n=1 Tax=Trichocladium antarcticum TaxID=1450529 RepID=A0AAN6ZCN6_9PEZI|nr:hypothetical protein BT67DRAFT_70363 [Trichocladium antarcticum]